MELNPIDDLCRCLPDHALRIRLLTLRDERFRAICDDYGEALRAIEAWRQDNDTAKRRAQEYRRMAEELREEARTYLKSHSDA
jgi:hypothetical protein